MTGAVVPDTEQRTEDFPHCAFRACESLLPASTSASNELEFAIQQMQVSSRGIAHPRRIEGTLVHCPAELAIQQREIHHGMM